MRERTEQAYRQNDGVESVRKAKEFWRFCDYYQIDSEERAEGSCTVGLKGKAMERDGRGDGGSKWDKNMG